MHRSGTNDQSTSLSGTVYLSPLCVSRFCPVLRQLGHLPCATRCWLQRDPRPVMSHVLRDHGRSQRLPCETT
jgi:hypothetical protein